jgi:hypothetical protein
LKLNRANLSTSWLRARAIGGKIPFYDSALPFATPEGEAEDTGSATGEVLEALAPRLVAVAQLPDPVPAESYFVFVPDPDPGAKVPYKVAVIDANPRRFPGGSHLIYNLSSRRLRGAIGGTPFHIKPTTYHLVGAGDSRTREGYLPVEIQYSSGNDWNRLALTRWQESEDAQRLCLAFEARGRIEIRTFQQYVAPVDPSEIEEMETESSPEDIDF